MTSKNVDRSWSTSDDLRKREKEHALGPQARAIFLPAVLLLSATFSAIVICLSFGEWNKSPSRLFSDTPRVVAHPKGLPNLLIVGCAKDLEEHLPELEVGFRALNQEWNLSGIWMYADDNRTHSILRDWYVHQNSTTPTTLTDPSNLVRILVGDDLEERRRTVRLSTCRKALWRAIFEYHDKEVSSNNDVDTFVMMMDYDEVNYHMSGLATCLDMPDGSWYGCCANQYALYYDIWALRAEGWLDCDFKQCSPTRIERTRGDASKAKEKLSTFPDTVTGGTVLNGVGWGVGSTKFRQTKEGTRRRLQTLQDTDIVDEETAAEDESISSSVRRLAKTTLRARMRRHPEAQNASFSLSIPGPPLKNGRQPVSESFDVYFRHVSASRNPFAVDSCFGGATLYHAFRWKEIFRNLTRSSYIPTFGSRIWKRETCEHVSFHLDLNEALQSGNGGPQLFIQPKFLTQGKVGIKNLKSKEKTYMHSWRDDALTPYYGRYLRALELGPEKMVSALPTVLEKEEGTIRTAAA